jgi:hypothetical protein
VQPTDAGTLDYVHILGSDIEVQVSIGTVATGKSWARKFVEMHGVWCGERKKTSMANRFETSSCCM